MPDELNVAAETPAPNDGVLSDEALNAELYEAYDRTMKDDEGGDPEPSGEGETGADETTGRSRDERGRYAKENGGDQDATDEDDGEEPPVAGQGEDEESETTEDEASADDEEPISRPQRLDGIQDEEWEALPKTVQQALADREQKLNVGFSRMGRDLKAFEPIGQVMQQHDGLFKHLNVPPEQAIDSALRQQAFLLNNPSQALPALAQHYGVDLEQLAVGSDPSSAIKNIAQKHGVDLWDMALGMDDFENTGGAPATAHDPRVDEVTKQLESVTRFISEQQRAQTEHQQRIQAQHEQFALSAFDEVAQAHPELETDDALGAAVEHLIPVVRSENPNLSNTQLIQEALDRARWAIPGYRDKLLKEQVSRQTKETVTAATKRAAKSKKASSLNVKGSGSVNPAPISEADELAGVAEKYGLA